MVIFILWVLFAALVGVFGNSRTIGFWGSFLLSLILSPVIGLIIAACTNSNDHVNYEKHMLAQRIRQSVEKAQPKSGIADELQKFKQLFDSGTITEDEFNKQREKLLS